MKDIKLKTLVNGTYGLVIATLAGIFGYLQFSQEDIKVDSIENGKDTKDVVIEAPAEETSPPIIKAVPYYPEGGTTPIIDITDNSKTPENHVQKWLDKTGGGTLVKEPPPDIKKKPTQKVENKTIKQSTSEATSTPYLLVQSFPTYNKVPFHKSHAFRKIVWTFGQRSKVRYYALANKTISFDNLTRQVSEIGEGKRGHLDIHFNKGGGSGPVALTNSSAYEFGKYYIEEMRIIYQEQGWKLNQSTHPRVSKLGVLKYGERRGLHSVIGEFCFADDALNGTKPIEFAMTEAGSQRIALGVQRAAERFKLDTLTLSVGHWGPRGEVGATIPSGKFEGIHENEFSIFQINAIRKAIPGKTRGPTYKLTTVNPSFVLKSAELTNLTPTLNSTSTLATWPSFVKPPSEPVEVIPTYVKNPEEEMKEWITPSGEIKVVPKSSYPSTSDIESTQQDVRTGTKLPVVIPEQAPISPEDMKRLPPPPVPSTAPK